MRNGGAMSARALVAEISRRFGAPQMADRATRDDDVGTHLVLRCFQ